MFQTQIVKKIKTHFKFNLFFPLKSCHLIDNVQKYLERGKPQMTIIIRPMCFACWIPKAANIHSGCVIFIVFPLQKLLQERTSILCYTDLFWFRNGRGSSFPCCRGGYPNNEKINKPRSL